MAEGIPAFRHIAFFRHIILNKQWKLYKYGNLHIKFNETELENIMVRMRRLRSGSSLRDLVRETAVTTNDLVYHVFII